MCNESAPSLITFEDTPSTPKPASVEATSNDREEQPEKKMCCGLLLCACFGAIWGRAKKNPLATGMISFLITVAMLLIIAGAVHHALGSKVTEKAGKHDDQVTRDADLFARLWGGFGF